MLQWVPDVPLIAPSILEGLKQLAIQFTDKFQEQNGWLESVVGISNHWRLKENQEEAFRKDLKEPAAGMLYVHWDFEEPSC